ncbi:hypothetical protein HJG60_011215 [Phyllostomus discolor]|uniref:Uncharacterized protein n=1 Tax=Phyllostomus discolor TaxID=89673 RepID=A0A833ZX74_9CHIR|nr:hypothetical protein HJG60_011215 [Phyllostomus discolor]
MARAGGYREGARRMHSRRQPCARLGGTGLRGLQPARPASDPARVSQKGRGGSCGRANTLQPRPLQLGSRVGRVCPFPGWGLPRRGVEGPGGQWVGDYSDWRLGYVCRVLKTEITLRASSFTDTEIQHCKTRHRGIGLIAGSLAASGCPPRSTCIPRGRISWDPEGKGCRF